MARPSNKVCLVDKITGEVVRKYKSIDAAKAAYEDKGLYAMVLHKTLREGRYVLRYCKDYNPRENYSGKNNAPYAIFKDDQCIFIANNSREVCKRFYCDVSIVNKHARNKTKMCIDYDVVRLMYMGMIYDICDKTGKRYGY